MSSQTPRLNTRDSNKNKHPGVDHFRYTITRRNPAEIQAEKAAKAAAKAEKEAQKKNAQQKAAEIKEQIHQKMQEQKNHTGILTSSKLSIPHKKNERPPGQNVVARGCFFIFLFSETNIYFQSVLSCKRRKK